jgi:hypothetical protein
MLSPDIKAELLEIIDKLAELEKRTNEIRQQESETRERISVIRAKNLVEIAVAKDSKEKSLYPSERVRDAALTVALDKDTEYRTLRENFKILENKLQEIYIEQGRLSDRKALLMLDAGLVKPSSSETSIPIE